MGKSGDQEGVKMVVEEVKVAKALAKECYKAKLENCLQENNTRQVWGATGRSQGTVQQTLLYLARKSWQTR